MMTLHAEDVGSVGNDCLRSKMMMLKRSGNRIAQVNVQKNVRLNSVLCVVLVAIATLFVATSAGATGLRVISLNESEIPSNATSSNMSDTELESGSPVTELPEGATSILSPKEACTSNSILNKPSETPNPIIEPIHPPMIPIASAIPPMDDISTNSDLVYGENGIAVETIGVKMVTDNSAILCGKIYGGKKDEAYIVKFRYNYYYRSSSPQTMFSDPKEVKFSSDDEQIYFEIPVINLRPGVEYYCRALCGISDPYVADSNHKSFKTNGITNNAITIDSDLIRELERLFPDDEPSKYFNDSWGIRPSQYKLMILTCIMGEGGLQGYSVQSSLYKAFRNETTGVLYDYPDTFRHVDNSNFYYGAGIGPMQIDQGQTTEWHKWSTLKKYNWRDCLESTLSITYDKLNVLEISSMEDVRNGLKKTWFAYKDSAWPKTWSTVTGKGWTEVAYSGVEEGSLGDGDAQEIIESVSGEWNNFHTVIRKIGNLRWKIEKNDGIVTYSNPDVPLEIDGLYETYQISARNLYGQHTFLYVDLPHKNTELWAYYDGDINDVKNVFARTYEVNGETAAYKIDPTSTKRTIATLPGSIQSDPSTLVYSAGKTTTNPVIQNAAVVESFSLSPNQNNLKVGDKLQFDYEVSAPEGISNVFLLRITDEDYCNDAIIDDSDLWDPIPNEEKTDARGVINDTSSPSTGTYWYGLHVVDNTGTWACEKAPIRVTIFDSSHIPVVIPPKAGTPYDGDSICIMIKLKSIAIADKYEVVLSNGEIQKSKEYLSLPETILDSEIWGSDLPDGQYTVKYRYHFNDNDQYGYAEGYSDFSKGVSFTVGDAGAARIVFDSAQPFTSVAIKIKENAGAAGTLSASDSYVENVQDGESPGTYIFRGTTPLNISIADLSRPLPSGIVSSGTDSEDYVSGDKLEIKFSKFGYATTNLNITLGETDSVAVDLTPITPPSGLTDLIAKRIFTTAPIRRGEDTSFYVEVVNDGDIAAGSFNVGLWFYNGTLNLLGKKEVSSIPAQGSHNISGWSVMWPSDNESYPVIAWVDSDGVIDETDEINNLFPGIGQASEHNNTAILHPPILLSPENGSTIGDDTPTFIWSPAEGADYYCLNFSKEPYSYFHTAKEIVGTSYTQPFYDRFLRDGNFRWNVTSYNTTFGWSDVSPDSYFTLKADRTKLRNPKDIDIGTDGLIYALDEGNFQVQVFATNGTPIRRWGSYGSNDGEFGGDPLNGPWGMALSPDGKVYVADTHNSRIQIFSSDGTYISQLNSTVTSLWQPNDVAIDSKGNVFVAICAGSSNSVAIFDSNLNFIAKWSVDRDTFYPLKTIFVDSNNVVFINGYNGILKYSSEGEYIGEIGPIKYDPRSIYVNEDGNIYVACESDYKVLSSSGSIISEIDLDVDNYGWPRDVIVGSDSVIYCASGYTGWNSRNYISKFDLNGDYIGKFDGTPPSIANFIASPLSGKIPLTVYFQDLSSNSISSWLWTFGDNATSTDQNPTHTYTAPGNYTVTLSINGGAETCTKTAYIKVTPVLYGDANDDNAVNQADTLRVLKEVVGLVQKPAADTEQFWKTDVHRNGAIDVGDALFIAQYNVGLRDVWFARME